MTLRAATLFAGLLLPSCASKTAVSDDDAPVLATFAPDLRARIVDRLGGDGVRLLENASAFDVTLYHVPNDEPDDEPDPGAVVAQRRIESDDERAQLVQFFYDVAASDDPPCNCEPVLSYRVTTTDGSAEARVIGHPVSVRVDQRTLMQVPPLRAKQTLSSLVPDPDPMSQP